MDLIAHRGCAGQFPENTVRSIQESALHVQYVELDVRRCGSSELVAFHDRRIDEKTDSTGLLAETDLSELRDLTVGGTDERIPSLREALDAFPADVGVQLDLKVENAAAESVRLAEEADVEVLLLSGDRSVVSSAADVVDAPAGYIVDRETLDEDVEAAVEMGCEFVYVTYERCTDAALVDRIHGAGLGVNAGTIREADAAEQYAGVLRDAGVDYLSVDRCDWDLE